MISYVINQFVEERDAVINVSDLSIQRGFGIFDFLRVANNIPLFMQDHLNRFFRSAAELRLQPVQTREEIAGIIAQLIGLNNMETSGFKIILTGGYSYDGFEPANPNLIIIQQPVQLPTTEAFETGVRIILHEYMRDLAEAKSINYLMSIYLREKIVQAGADDVLYYKDAKILEFPRSNIFVVTKDQHVITPSQNVLRGITRDHVLKISGQHYKTEERDVSLAELADAAEVFLTSSTKRVFPVTTINGRQIGDGKPGPVTRSLLSHFLLFEEEYINKSRA